LIWGFASVYSLGLRVRPSLCSTSAVSCFFDKIMLAPVHFSSLVEAKGVAVSLWFIFLSLLLGVGRFRGRLFDRGDNLILGKLAK